MLTPHSSWVGLLGVLKLANAYFSMGIYNLCNAMLTLVYALALLINQAHASCKIEEKYKNTFTILAL